MSKIGIVEALEGRHFVSVTYVSQSYARPQAITVLSYFVYIPKMYTCTQKEAHVAGEFIPMKNADYRTSSCYSSFRLLFTLFRIPLRYSLIIIVASHMDLGWVHP